MISEITTVRLCLIAASNILAAAPADDAYGVTQSALKPSIKIMKRLIKGLDILIRNNQQRFVFLFCQRIPMTVPFISELNFENCEMKHEQLLEKSQMHMANHWTKYYKEIGLIDCSNTAKKLTSLNVLPLDLILDIHVI